MESAFQLTTSQGGRRKLDAILIGLKDFQLTTSQGGRHIVCHENATFNFLSTHDLTRRSTTHGENQL